MADYVYSLTSFVRNPNSGQRPVGGRRRGRQDLLLVGRALRGVSRRAVLGRTSTSPTSVPIRPIRSACKDGRRARTRTSGTTSATFNAFDLVNPLEVATAIGQFQNGVLPIPGARGELLDYVTPTLVDVWNTAPYNHDGGFATLLHGIFPCDTTLDAVRRPRHGQEPERPARHDVQPRRRASSASSRPSCKAPHNATRRHRCARPRPSRVSCA